MDSTTSPTLLAVPQKNLGREIVRVPWSEVAEIAAKIKLRSSARDLGLGKADRKAERWMIKLLRS
jgi:hypothetical protein